MIENVLLEVFFGSAALGCLYMIIAAFLVPSFARRGPEPGRAQPGVTILRPLHGDEPGLFDNLASFCNQDYAGPVQIIFGVADPHDPAIRAVKRLQAAFPDRQLELVVDSRITGSNPKVSNLINMSFSIEHEIVVLADSDILVGPDYLARVVSALDQFGGAVTCPYFGVSAGGLWSRLAQLTINGHFLPGVMVSVRFRLARPCLGSTIALSRTSLTAIGGFEGVADCLADDHALGELMRKRGEPVSVLPFAVGHICGEASWRELWYHELRWASTIRTIDPSGYIGWAVTHAFPLALAAALLGGGLPALMICLAALACRFVLVNTVESAYGLPPHPYWLIPVRDLLSFAVFLLGFAARAVSWKGRRYWLLSAGSLVPERGSPSP